jgi:hypothetical protein
MQISDEFSSHIIETDGYFLVDMVNVAMGLFIKHKRQD